MRGKRWMVLVVVAMLAVFAGSGQAAIIYANSVIGTTGDVDGQNAMLGNANGVYGSIGDYIDGYWSGSFFRGNLVYHPGIPVSGSITVGFASPFYDVSGPDAGVSVAFFDQLSSFDVSARQAGTNIFTNLTYDSNFLLWKLFEISGSPSYAFDAIKISFAGGGWLNNSISIDSIAVDDTAPSQPVPEPGTMMLLGSGLVGLAGWGRKKFRK